MMSFYFSNQGRINRGKYWLSLVGFLAVSAVAAVILTLLWQIMPGTAGEDGSFNVNGVTALPYLIVTFSYIILMVWGGVCVGTKRCHDRNRSGWFMLIQLIPLVGVIWYLVEVGCLRGTVGPNNYGPDPLA